MQTLTHQLVPTWVLQFCCFFVFSRFCYFWSITKKTSSKQNTTQVFPRPAPPWLCFFCFLEVLATFGQKPKKTLRKPTKKTTQVLPRPAPLWFCFFVFCFLEERKTWVVFLFFLFFRFSHFKTKNQVPSSTSPP